MGTDMSCVVNVPERLTLREYEVMRGLVTRKTYREIAEELGVKVNTVKFHSKNIYSKWSVTRRPEAIAFWTAHALEGTAHRLVPSDKNAEIASANIHLPERMNLSFIGSWYFRIELFESPMKNASSHQLPGYDQASLSLTTPKRSESNVQ
jgi:DNA-binding CsgD family transcriptional regulator